MTERLWSGIKTRMKVYKINRIKELRDAGLPHVMAITIAYNEIMGIVNPCVFCDALVSPDEMKIHENQVWHKSCYEKAFTMLEEFSQKQDSVVCS